MVQANRFDDPSIKDVGEVAKALGTDLENGLASPEASRRLSEDGPNELHAAPRAPAWRRFLAQFQDPLIYLLLAAVGIALAARPRRFLRGGPCRPPRHRRRSCRL